MGFSLGASFFSPDGSFAAYEDSVGISLGNAMTDYSGNAEVDAAFAQKGKFIKAEVTFTNVISHIRTDGNPSYKRHNRVNSIKII